MLPLVELHPWIGAFSFANAGCRAAAAAARETAGSHVCCIKSPRAGQSYFIHFSLYVLLPGIVRSDPRRNISKN
jgi:hypothetical protein